MRIISKLHDFYDSAMSFGHTDNAYIFNRSTETIKPTPSDAEKLFDVLFDESCDLDCRWLHHMIRYPHRYGATSSYFAKHGFLAFCGFIYPFIQLREDAVSFGGWEGSEACRKLFAAGEKLDHNHNAVTFYDEAAALRFIDKLHENNFFKYGLNNKAEYNYWVDYIQGFFKLAPKPFANNFIKEYSIQLGTPYFMVSNFISRNNANHLEVTKTPTLKKLQFQKLLDSNTAYQEISMFFCGVIGTTEKEIINISDKDLRDAKGFNDKSFKAGKSTKKRKQK